MCGIFGFLKFEPKNVRFRESHRFLSHRGPDENGIFEDSGIFLAHHRLSIIDLSSGRQPMANEDRSVWVTYNGEVYNYRELKKELEAKGHRFATTSDTEVLVHLYEEFGEGMLEKMNGMFAFAIWDSRNKTLFCARDRLGIKPFYYASSGEGIIFSSEIRPILDSRLVPQDIDRRAFFDFLSYRYIPGPGTIFTRIRELEAGHCLTVRDKDMRVRKYWGFEPAMARSAPGRKEAARTVEHLLKRAVESMLVSDVPFGIFLSGGIDSSLILSFMAESLGKNVEAFSIGFEDAFHDETPYARMMAEHFGARLHTFTFTSKDLLDNLIPAISQFDQPFADEAAIPTYLLSRETKKHVKMVLSGEGGDELFFGYIRYRTLRKNLLLNRALGFLPSSLREKTSRFVHSPVEKIRVYAKALKNIGKTPSDMYFTWISPNISLSDILHGDLAGSLADYRGCALMEDYFKSGDPLNDARLFDLGVYLPYDLLKKVDMMTMAFGLEARVPFLDHELVENVLGLPWQYHMDLFSEKKLLRKIAEKRLPRTIVKRKKHGFFVPAGKWFRTGLKETLMDAIASSDPASSSFFNKRFLLKMADDHIKGKSDYSRALWMVFCFELWHRRLQDKSAGA